MECVIIIIMEYERILDTPSNLQDSMNTDILSQISNFNDYMQCQNKT